MKTKVRVALVGDYREEVPAHRAIPQALALAAEHLGCDVVHTWVDTDRLGDSPAKVRAMLASFDGLWCVPASPYKNAAGAIMAIQFARENKRPFFASCGGYQHAILEFAQNVLGYSEAGNIETEPDTTMPIIAPLVCALVEENGEVHLTAGSKVALLYGQERVTEAYHCSYGLNETYLPRFADSDLRITGYDLDNDPRVFELQNHPFFIGTAYQPERSAFNQQRHPLITAFVSAMSEA